MGLLDGFLSLDEHQRQAMLAAAAAMLQNKGNTAQGIGAGIGQGLLGYNTSKGLGDRRAEEAQQRQMREMAMERERQASANQAGLRSAFQSAFAPPQMAPNDPYQEHMTPGGGGMPEFLRQGGQFMDPMQAAQMLQPPKPKMAFAPNGQAVDMNSLKPGADYGKPQELPAGMRMGANGPEEIPGYVEMRRKIAAAGAPSVTTNVMPPREVFKDSLSLKKDFDGQPEVKGFREVQQAWDQISTALKKPSPANDLAAATKYMKLLDPSSVVRESELNMAMQASGAWDRMANYHNRLLKGEKLTPQQREDFHSAGQALYEAAKGRYGETVGQYEGIAKQYGLDSQFIPKDKQQASGLQKNLTATVKAKDAIKRGADPAAVRRRLIEQGYDPEGL